MIQTLPDPGAGMLPQWVKEALAKQLRTQFPAESEQRICRVLEDSAGRMGPVCNLASLHAAATVLLRKQATPRDPR